MWKRRSCPWKRIGLEEEPVAIPDDIHALELKHQSKAGRTPSLSPHHWISHCPGDGKGAGKVGLDSVRASADKKLGRCAVSAVGPEIVLQVG